MEHLYDRSVPTIEKCIQNVINLYNPRGFRIDTICGDNEFLPLKEFINEKGIILNTSAANEHVSHVERNNRTIKERVRAD